VAISRDTHRTLSETVAELMRRGLGQEQDAKVTTSARTGLADPAPDPGPQDVAAAGLGGGHLGVAEVAPVGADGGGIEVGTRAGDGRVLIRDTKHREGPVLAVGRDTWWQFAERVKADPSQP